MCTFSATNHHYHSLKSTYFLLLLYDIKAVETMEKETGMLSAVSQMLSQEGKMESHFQISVIIQQMNHLCDNSTCYLLRC